MNNLIEDYRKSRIAAIWRVLWRAFPNFSARHSPIYFGEDGAILWNQGFGRVAYLRGDKVLIVGWGLGAEPNERRVFVTQATRWEPPHAHIPVSAGESEALAALVNQKYTRKGEKVVFQ